jgi:hypothetical protein
MKDYLAAENERNHRNHRVYERFMRLATGEDTNVLVKHHITFEVAADGEPNEVPSADTLMFCHELMEKVFGMSALALMAQLAVRPVEERDAHFEQLVARREMNGATNFSIAESVGGSQDATYVRGTGPT